MIEGASYETEGSKIQNKGNSKISEWLKPEPEPEIIPVESSNTKYYIIAGIIVGCLAAYYWGDITPIIKNLYDKIKPKKDGSDGNNPGVNIEPELDKPSVGQRLLNIFNRDRGNNPIQPELDKARVEQTLLDTYNDLKSDVSQIDLQDNTQNIASTSNLDASSSSGDSMNHYFTKPDNLIDENLPLFQQITGQSFDIESNSLQKEITTFLGLYDTAKFQNQVATAGLYKIIRTRLQTLSELRTKSYEQMLENNPEVDNNIQRFLGLEDQYYNQHNYPQNESNSLDNQINIDNQNVLETQSDTYEEVATANIESRMAWSDRATPSVHSQVLSPISNHGNLDNLIDNTDNLDDTNLLNAVKETLAEDVGLKLDTSEVNIQNTSQDLPKIDIDTSSSSNSSNNQYFNKPEVSQEDIKPKYSFSDMLASIRARRDDSNVVGSPQISQVGLTPRLSPLNTKPSISNLLDDTQALFDDDDEVIPVSNIDKGKAKEVDTNLLSTASTAWDNVQTNVQYGDSPHNITVDIKYGELWTRISKYRFVMNTGQVIDFDYNFEGNVVNKSRTFDLANKIDRSISEQVDIKEIIILDLNYIGNSVWKNTKFFN